MPIDFSPICEIFVENLLLHLQPAKETELQRWEVVQHLQAVLFNSLRCQPFLFGSVAYKTYLPDGDIDVTVPCAVDVPHLEHLELIRVALESCSDVNKRPRGVTIIDANVKVLKMVLQGFYVDLSINQTGGLTTLCFLQEVDNAIGGQHLFKRALLLLKAWCRYEAEILGSCNGLIGTYALTTMLLAIFNLFEGLDTPLKVFFQFLAYYSTLALEDTVITMYGPQPADRAASPPPKEDGPGLFPRRTSPLIPYSLPEKWQAEWGDSPLWTPPGTRPPDLEDSPRSEEEKGSEDTSIGSLSGDSRPEAQEDWRPRFPFRSVNVQDPLRPMNNLGRSITHGNVALIRRALLRGYHALLGLLQGPPPAPAQLAAFFPHLLRVCGMPQDLTHPLGAGRSLFDRIADPRACPLPLCGQCQRPVGTSIFCIDLENLKANLTRSRERPKALRPLLPLPRGPRWPHGPAPEEPEYPFQVVNSSNPVFHPSGAYVTLWQGEPGWLPYVAMAPAGPPGPRPQGAGEGPGPSPNGGGRRGGAAGGGRAGGEGRKRAMGGGPSHPPPPRPPRRVRGPNGKAPLPPR